MKLVVETLNELDGKPLWEANVVLFNAPTLVYITIPKKRTLYNIFDSGAAEMSVMAAAQEHGVDSLPAYEAIKYPDIIGSLYNLHYLINGELINIKFSKIFILELINGAIKKD